MPPGFVGIYGPVFMGRYLWAGIYEPAFMGYGFKKRWRNAA